MEQTEVEISRLQVRNKIYLNNRWWVVTSITKVVDGYNLDLEAKFQGSVKVTLPVDCILDVKDYQELGHKGGPLLTNDSGQSKQQDRKMPNVVDSRFGLGSG